MSCFFCLGLGRLDAGQPFFNVFFRYVFCLSGSYLFLFGV